MWQCNQSWSFTKCETTSPFFGTIRSTARQRSEQIYSHCIRTRENSNRRQRKEKEPLTDLSSSGTAFYVLSIFDSDEALFSVLQRSKWNAKILITEFCYLFSTKLLFIACEILRNFAAKSSISIFLDSSSALNPKWAENHAKDLRFYYICCLKPEPIKTTHEIYELFD